MLQADAVKKAEKAAVPVQHPILDTVRQCSTNPDAAADFFVRMLHPCPAKRMSLEAKHHAYIAAAYTQMEEYYAGRSPTSVLPQDVSESDSGMFAILLLCQAAKPFTSSITGSG